jgi:hypothetical protein
VDYGVKYGLWSSVPWVGLVDNGTTVWVATGKKGGFPMSNWRHTCLAFCFVEGTSIMYENGRLVSEDKFDEYIQFGKKMPDSLSIITVGCIYDTWSSSHPGVVTDFQLFDRMLSKQEMEDWSSCNKTIPGDVVNWDLEVWILNNPANASDVEYLDFDEDVCDMRDNSNHLFPIRTTFTKSLKLCEKVSGKLIQ